MVVSNDLSAVFLPWEDPSAFPVTPTRTARTSYGRDGFGGQLRHRRNQSIDLNEAIASLSLASHEFSGRYPSSPSLCSTTSCGSDDSEFSDRLALSEARTLFGFPYPLLVCLLISFVLLPMQLLIYNNRGEAQQHEQRSYLSGNQHRRSLADTLTFEDDTLMVRLEQPSEIDAVVLVAIGPAATSPVLGWSVYSVVQVGGWDGLVYIVTDQPEDVKVTLTPADTSPAYHNPSKIHIVPHEVDMPPSLTSFNAKLTKCSLLKILPDHLRNIVYIDSDIIVGKPLAPFWKSVAKIWESAENPEEYLDIVDDDVSIREFKAATEQAEVSMGLFEDGKSFTAGFCKDCDHWNTGVMSISRGKSDSCLNAWCETLRVNGGTDQAALDEVIAAGSECQNIQALDRHHVRMMKDVFVVLGMVGTRTFNHFTGIFRPQNLIPLHRRFYERMLGKDLRAVERITARTAVSK